MSYIFVLLLEKNKYFVGMCNNPDHDIQKYYQGYGPKWIKKYTPKKIVEIIHPCDMFDLDKQTKRYMAKYGISEVRGGAYSSIKLSKSDKNHIDKEIFTAMGMCMHCGSDMHISQECPFNTISGQLRQFVNMLKINYQIFKDKVKVKVQPCVDYFRGNDIIQQPYNTKYNTQVLEENEQRSLLVYNSSINYDETLIDSPEDNSSDDIFPSPTPTPLPEESDESSYSVSFTPPPDIQSPYISPIPSPPHSDLEKLDQTANDILRMSLNSVHIFLNENNKENVEKKEEENDDMDLCPLTENPIKTIQSL